MLSGSLAQAADWLGRVGLKKTQQPALIGLDISSSAVKLLEISRAGRNHQIDRYRIEPLPRDAVVDGNLNQIEAVADAIRRAWQALDTTTRDVAVALPTTMAIYRKILVPMAQSQELEALIESEAQQYIPFALDEVNLDYQVLGPAAHNPDDLEVMLCAARKEKVDERVAAVEMAGLKAAVVDVDAFATLTAFEQIQLQLPEQGMNQTFALFDIGATKIYCNVIRNGQQLYYREQAFGGQQLTRDIQRRYGIPYEEAERGKCSMSLPDGYEAELLHPFVDSLAQEIQRALQFFYTTVSVSQYLRVDYLLLAGGSSLLPGLDDAVSARTQISTMIANPFTTMVQSAAIRPKALLLDAPSLLVACGLALRRFD
ncbi:type IV pilus assembly protein PilM [Crenobacter luteus]|uniref:Pilus assembly protein PilM n=2 Tax=Crenobacter luteus TaxID=1452487 RepID=A0A161SBS3_9NEIS|nr:pilus assembly protein PilM [Crenobacter luteus]KZE33473.1 pilus assembly protein PilM [Crenobacter luteus]TCP13098.1 type IV pilus assembly protein PilM [Crenobacter luteus]